MNCQIVLDSWCQRGWTDVFDLFVNGENVGYAQIGSVPPAPRTCIVEFFVTPGAREYAGALFRRLVVVSRATEVETQSNDRVLTALLLDAGEKITSPAILFEAGRETDLHPSGAIARRITREEFASAHPAGAENTDAWGVEVEGEIVATGGFLTHYNHPFADIYMEVVPPHRRRGYGAFLVQELKRACRDCGLVPGARCNAANIASKATLERAGMVPCARMLCGTIGLMA